MLDLLNKNLLVQTTLTMTANLEKINDPKKNKKDRNNKKNERKTKPREEKNEKNKGRT